jgi:hypothetical protein
MEFHDIFVDYPISHFTEIREVGIQLIHVDRRLDGQTDEKKDGWTNNSLIPSR